MKCKTITIAFFTMSLLAVVNSSFSQDTNSLVLKFPEIKYINVPAPLTISQIDFKNAKYYFAPPKVNTRIKKIILNYFFDSGLDSAPGINLSDVYFNTLRIENGSYSFFIALLKAPSVPLTSKIFA